MSKIGDWNEMGEATRAGSRAAAYDVIVGVLPASFLEVSSRADAGGPLALFCAVELARREALES